MGLRVRGVLRCDAWPDVRSCTTEAPVTIYLADDVYVDQVPETYRPATTVVPAGWMHLNERYLCPACCGRYADFVAGKTDINGNPLRRAP